MRRPSPRLFELIKSLNKAEILNFRSHASRRKGEKHYMAVFDALLELDEMDEEAFKTKLDDSVSLAHLYKTKNYLYKIILDSLVGTNQEDEYELYTQIQKIIILILKSLFSHAEELFPEAHRIAAEQDNFEAIRILLGEERNLLKARDMQIHLSDRLREIRVLELEVAEKSYNLLQYNHLLDKANALFQYPREEREAYLNEIIKNPLMREERQFRSTSSRILFWLIKAKVDQATGNYDLSRLALENAAELYEAHPGLLEGANSFRNYLDLLKNLFITQLVTGKREMALDVGKKMRLLSEKTEKGRFLVLERYFHAMLAYMGHSRDEKLAQTLIPEYRSFQKEFQGRINKLYSGTNDFVIACFLQSINRPQDAQFWIYRILNEEEEVLRPETILYTRILQLITLYDSEESRFLAQAIRSGKEYMRRKKLQGAPEKMFLQYFQRLMNAENNQARTQSVFEEFLQDWKKNLSAPEFMEVQMLVDVEAWITRKLV